MFSPLLVCLSPGYLKCIQGRINEGALGARPPGTPTLRAPGPPTLRTPGPPTLRDPGPPQKRSCFENDESKFSRITTSIISSESNFLFMRQPCRNRNAARRGAKSLERAPKTACNDGRTFVRNSEFRKTKELFNSLRRLCLIA